MSPLERPRIFISYAHRDGANLALRLQADLEALGFDVGLDKHRLLAADAWARRIETEIDARDVTLALRSFHSDICRAERERSLAKGKLVIPLRVHADSDVALYLRTRQYIDFSDDAN